MALLFALLLGISSIILWHMLVDFSVHVPIESFGQYQRLSLLMIALMANVVLVSFGISYFVVSRINRIATTAHEIVATKDLSRRIAIDTEWDDLSNLAQLLNKFLSHIETLMIGVREVSNNIAHDLRTPLAGLRSDIESLKSSHVEDHHLDALINETDKMMGIFQSLLRITNIEQGKRAHAFAAIDLNAILKDVIELYEPLAEEKEVRFAFTVAQPLIVKGDADLLFQLFANILDNAVKFSPHNSAITIIATHERNQVSIIITDKGPGIADNEKEKVFKHFYRSDTSRSTAGNGLGLSLAKAIVEQHQGQITLTDGNPGLRVFITFQSYQ